jgi:hypothetical protein
MGSPGVTGRKRPFPFGSEIACGKGWTQVSPMPARRQLGARKNKGVGQDQEGWTRAGEKGRGERHRQTPPLRDHEQYLCLQLPRRGHAWTTRRGKAVLFYSTVYTSVKTAGW